MQVDDVKQAIKKLKVLESGDSGRINMIGDAECGICFHIDSYVTEVFKKSCYDSWEYYSGDATYPVPYVDGDTFYDYEYENDVPIESAEEAYEFLGVSKYLGEYGKLRRDLARHIRENLEEWLEEHDNER